MRPGEVTVVPKRGRQHIQIKEYKDFVLFKILMSQHKASDSYENIIILGKKILRHNNRKINITVILL